MGGAGWNPKWQKGGAQELWGPRGAWELPCQGLGKGTLN